jgi:hypothetical protein
MSTLNELEEKITELEKEKTKLVETKKILKGEAYGKMVQLACEITVLQKDIDYLKKIIV